MRTSLGAAALYFSAPGCSSKGFFSTRMRSFTCSTQVWSTHFLSYRACSMLHSHKLLCSF